MNMRLLERDWMGCTLTIAFILGMSVGLPVFALFLGVVNSWERALVGIGVFGLVGVGAIVLVLDAYLVRINEGGVSRGLLSSVPLDWTDVERVEIALGIRLIGKARSVSVFPFVFRKREELDQFLQAKLGNRFQFH